MSAKAPIKRTTASTTWIVREMLAICTDRLRCYGVLQHFCVNVAAALLVIAVLPDLLSKLASNL